MAPRASYRAVRPPFLLALLSTKGAACHSSMRCLARSCINRLSSRLACAFRADLADSRNRSSAASDCADPWDWSSQPEGCFAWFSICGPSLSEIRRLDLIWLQMLGEAPSSAATGCTSATLQSSQPRSVHGRLLWAHSL